MKKIEVALAPGDGAAPEMMAAACEVVQVAARKDDCEIVFIETPMGWSAYDEFGDTLPQESLEKATEIRTLFFGGVGDPDIDETLGVTHPEMKPEARCLLTIRAKWQLLLNFRPMVYIKALDELAKVRPDFIPEAGVEQHWIRFLLQDSYFGNVDLRDQIPNWEELGILLKHEVTGEEDQVIDIAYYTRDMVEKYARYAFKYAKQLKLPVISVDKANVMSRYVFWREVINRIGSEEFPEVEIKDVYVDAENALLFEPGKLHGVIACGNEHGDILSDGAAAAIGSLGLMHSSAINPDNGMAMFESGAGTAANIAGQGIANPIGRILTGAMMLDHLGCLKGAESIRRSVREALAEGYRTVDIVTSNTKKKFVVGTEGMKAVILAGL
jgi:3-isopropylmalate dehydrogenase